ncbi:hypothetical protein [Candidatus Thiodictyon syntrophicum]|jgi:hypothetical protein|uniref:Uncharacterized protein n=1 Tax=Candidatus Thiodictyon syntrophicum TaxID=1166950 RepID=A0A2K8UDQ2_9GAMM|nr:hypothetical protein [Candidatus Thiodictyon syntrophicum]AUB83607.1 hypothetical protein THSYN_23425 [Candidatus Thiodictyon syntrophicum]
MAHQARTRIWLALALLPALAPAATAAPGFCVEDSDDALWIDCERERSGVTGRAFVLCRRAPAKELIDRRAPRPVLIEVTDIARELSPGSGDCPAPRATRASGSAPDKDGLPRTDGDGADADGQVTDAAAPGAPAAGRPAGATPAPPGPAPSAARPVPETTHGR